MPAFNINCVFARSHGDVEGENAWVSLSLNLPQGDKLVPVAKFDALMYGDQAWAQASKHAQKLAAELNVPFRKKRGIPENPTAVKPRATPPIERADVVAEEAAGPAEEEAHVETGDTRQME